MEFIVRTDIAGTVPEVIDFNHAELKQELSVQLEKYQNLVVTEDAISAAKADRAKLNKLKEAMENRRKEIKNECLAPYVDFEVKVKELVAMVDKPIKAIDTQVKAFDEEKKKAKEDTIKAHYNEIMGDLASIFRLAGIWNPRWLNVTYKEADILAEIAAHKEKVERDTEAIKALGSENEDYLLDIYAQTLDLSKAIAEQKRFEEQKRRREEMEAKKAAQAKAKAEEAPTPWVPTGSAPPTRPADTKKTIEQPVTQMDFRVWATKEQLDGLKKYLLDNHIKYGRVK